MIYIKLFFEFFKIGLFSIGGGMATIPFLNKLSISTGWFSTEQLANMIAVSESTPGPIGVNMATYTGYVTAGPLGSVFATIGLAFPEILVIIIIASFLDKFRGNKYFEHVFYGIRPCSVGLIAAAGFLVTQICIFHDGSLDLKCIALIIFLFLMTRYIPKIKELHPVFFIIFSAVMGILFSF